MTWTTQPRSKRGGLAAICAGQGPSVLLLHGVGLRAEAWGAQIAALSSVANVTAPDLPGHGDSPVAVAEAVEDYTQALLPLVRDLPGPVWVIGHSMGAMLALDLARHLPGKIAGLAALNAIFERSAKAQAQVEARAAALDGRTPADPTATLTRWFGAAQTPARAACGRWLTAMDPAAYKRAYTAFAQSRVPSPAALQNLTCPALFLTGAEEPNSTPAMSHAMAALAPQGTAHIVPGAAHMLPMTHPDAVNAALLPLIGKVAA